MKHVLLVAAKKACALSQSSAKEKESNQTRLGCKCSQKAKNYGINALSH